MTNRTFYKVAGAALTVASGALLASTVLQKKKGTAACAVAVAAGLVGLTLGVILAYRPEMEAKQKLEMNDLLDDGDAERLQNNISEVLSER